MPTTLLFVHQNFPAQFGPLLSRIGTDPSYRCIFLSRTGDGEIPGVERLRFTADGGAVRQTHYSSRTFENVAWLSHSAADVLAARPDIRPDLIIAHSGFMTAAPLRDLFPDCPVINYFEFFYHPRNSDLDFRPENPPALRDRTRCRFRNAAILMDLYECTAGYSPTEFQRSLLPEEFRHKVRTIFDGVDTAVWHRRRAPGLRRIGNRTLPDDIRIVTYAARGFEAMRGFDVFMQFAKKLSARRSDVRFLVAGRDQVHYGGDRERTGGKSFKEWVLAQDTYDLSRFAFLGHLPPEELAELFSVSDLHVYLTVPFVLSWSLLNAMACGSVILGSDTPPVREVIAPGRTGRLAPFFDVDAMVEQAVEILDDPAAFRHLGENACEQVEQHYALDVCGPRIMQFFEDVMNGRARPA